MQYLLLPTLSLLLSSPSWVTQVVVTNFSGGLQHILIYLTQKGYTGQSKSKTVPKLTLGNRF